MLTMMQVIIIMSCTGLALQSSTPHGPSYAKAQETEEDISSQATCSWVERS